MTSENEAKSKQAAKRSDQLLLTQFTEQGLINLLIRSQVNPSVLYFETEEFDSFLRKFKQEYNSSIASFITKAYDADKIYEPVVKDNIKLYKKLGVAWSPALSIAGVLTGAAFADTKPKSAEHTGYDNRFVKFIGSPRSKDIPHIEPLDSTLQHRFKSCLRIIEKASRGIVGKNNQFDLELDSEAKELWEKEYLQFKSMLSSESVHSVMKPYYARAFYDYSKKIALNFQVLELADHVYQSRSAANHSRLSEVFVEKLEGLKINKASLEGGLAWARYFMDTANYAYFNYYASDNFDKKVNKAIVILEKHKLGITANQFRRELGLHRIKKEKLEFEELISYLKEEGTIMESDGKTTRSKVYKLRKHLVS